MPLLNERKIQLRWLLSAFAIVYVLDQLTKAIVMANIDAGPVYRDNTFFYFTHQRNEGLVGGMFRDVPAIAYTAPVLATFVLVYLFRHLDPASKMQALSFGMVFGGAIGNLTDRLRFGSVTDFLQFHFYFIPFDFYWKFYPAFNLADSSIVVGVTILVFTWNTRRNTNATDTV